MVYFYYFFLLLNNEKKIDNYESLIQFEDTLESNIQKIIKKYKEGISKNNLIINKNDIDKTSFNYLLKEVYTSLEYKKEDFPFYEYFYYTDYLNEEYINEKLSHMEKSKYPLLKNDLINELNLINERFSNKISRQYADKKVKKE